MNPTEILSQLQASGNLRSIPSGHPRCSILDFSTNDYLGLAQRDDLRQNFIGRLLENNTLFTSSASRLLASEQTEYSLLEEFLSQLYGRPALLFNSGYHANTGLIPALTDKNTLILADRLVHASIIDGIILSRNNFTRFRHNDFNHLRELLEHNRPSGENVLVIVESIYSMDGDTAPVEELRRLKQDYPLVTLYVDEAHAVGASGPRGIGLTHGIADIVIGTLGKAIASAGAYAILSEPLRDLAINRARSFIFSTALPPVNALWTLYMFQNIVEMDAQRKHLQALGAKLAQGLESITGRHLTPSHIQPFITGDARLAVNLSQKLLKDGIKVLPIRTPTVPAGTERLRISLSAAMHAEDVDRLLSSLTRAL